MQLTFGEKEHGEFGVLITLELLGNILTLAEPLLCQKKRRIGELEESAGGTQLVFHRAAETRFRLGNTNREVGVDAVVFGPLFNDLSRRVRFLSLCRNPNDRCGGGIQCRWISE